jgi:hypothetical protein
MQLTALETGGNLQFSKYLEFYQLREIDLPFRYQTFACDFYR